MQYVEHEDPHILVPRHISRNAFVSIQCFLLVATLSYYMEGYFTCLHLILLYIFSLLHWNCIYRAGWIKTVDTILAFSFYTIFTIKHSVRFYHFRSLWVYASLMAAISFAINKTIVYYQILYPRDMPEMVVHPNRVLQWFNNYFSLTYTKPNTAAREWAYYRSVYTHMVFIHFIPTMVSAFCAVSAYRYRMFDNPALCY